MSMERLQRLVLTSPEPETRELASELVELRTEFEVLRNDVRSYYADRIKRLEARVPNTYLDSY
jgi:hypothetical protein